MNPNCCAGRRTRARWAGLLLLTACLAAAQASTSAPGTEPALFVLGTPRPDGNYGGALLRAIYRQAFERLNIPLQIRTVPTARLSVDNASGAIDGDAGRLSAYGEHQPSLVRVEQPVLEVSIVLWSTDPLFTLRKLSDLAAIPLFVVFTRGVTECETLLQPVMKAGELVGVSTTVHALNLIHASRSALICGVDLAVLSDAGSPEFRNLAPLRQVLALAGPFGLYPYLHRKHAALAPRLAATLAQMKADGSIERLRQTALRQFRLPP